jgi:diguanylate cyclase (GGDEF)-like protein
VVLMTVAHLAAANNYQDRFDLETALEAASITDALTGLSNRRHFFPALEQELRRHRRYAHSLSVVIVDIDHFKQINDTHGHPTGDRAICAVGDVCRRLARETDLIARLGGEEFAILMPETDAANASEFAERVRGAVEATRLMSLQGVAFQLTVSIGVAELPAGAPGSGNLIDLADSALYQAKGAGRNRVVVSGDPKD